MPRSGAVTLSDASANATYLSAITIAAVVLFPDCDPMSADRESVDCARSTYDAIT
jgi:hypothetical protein